MGTAARGDYAFLAMRLLCISDIHGHLDALAAVLATAERRSFHKLLVAGDIVFPGPEPLDTWRRLMAGRAVLVQGLSDKALATLDPTEIRATNDHERERLERMRQVRAELGEIILERLKRLPTHVRFPLEDGRELLLVHGSPTDPGEALTEDMTDAEILALVGDDPADIVVCGMSHVPFERRFPDLHVINVGSIGEAPSGDGPSVAHATWIETSASGITVEPILVPLSPALPNRVAAGP
jgi:predicted phosphodiesterase